MVILARSNTVLENYDEAERQVGLLLESDPNNQEAQTVRSRINVLKAQKQLEQDSLDVRARKIQEDNIEVLRKQDNISKFDEILIKKSFNSLQVIGED